MGIGLLIMKQIAFSLILSLLTSIYVSGQERVTVRPGEDLSEVLSSGRYLFSQFEDARIILKNGTTHNAKMNYNALSGQMEFIDLDGDTLVIRNQPKIVAFGPRLFKHVPSLGYAEILSTNNHQIELLVHRKFNAGGRKKMGAYGISSELSVVDSFQPNDIERGRTGYSSGEEISYTKKNTFFIYADKKYRRANKATFIKIFGKDQLDQYLIEYPVDFNKQEDILRFFAFCMLK